MHIPGYRIEKELGRGGMATVYLAVQENLDRQVALKVMSAALLSDPSFGDRFLREAKIVAKLSHPHVIPIYDVGVSDEYYYIAMEYEPGGELNLKIKSGMSLTDAVSICKEMADVLYFAHENGYIHRDVKPANILFNTHGKSLLSDFGVARAFDSTSVVTAVGTIIGTPLYMSPEQVQGKPIDHRADLYSLGVVFYEMLIGRPPFQGDSAVTIAIKHMTEPVPGLPVKFALLQSFFDKILAKEPDDRYQSGLEIITALNQIDLAPATISRKLEGASARLANNRHELHLSQQAKSLSSVWLVSSVLVGILVLVGGMYFTQTQGEIDPAGFTSTETLSTPVDSIVVKQTKTNSGPDLMPEHDQVARLLALASQDRVNKRFVTPPEDNAYQKYMSVLKIDQDNQQASEGLREISDHYFKQAESALMAARFAQAKQYYAQAQDVDPQHPGLLVLGGKIDLAEQEYNQQKIRMAAEQEKARLVALEKAKLKALEIARLDRERQEAERAKLEQKAKLEQNAKLEQERLAMLALKKQRERDERIAKVKAEEKKQAKLTKIKSLYQSATTLLMKSNLSVSSIEQASDLISQIAAIDLKDPSVKKGRTLIINAYGDMAEKEWSDKNYEQADSILKKGLNIEVSNPRLLELQENINRDRLNSQRVVGGF